MRWFVEISPLGASEGQKQKWCLEAAGWQPALKDARAHRGEEGPLGGFSIELLDDGARAVDPVTRIRYVIRSAPDDAPLTHTKDGPVKAAPAKPAAAPEPAKPAAAPEPAKPAAAPEPAKPEASADDVDIPVDEDEATEAAPLPDYQVLQAREENPNERSPLTYREYVYAVAPSTPDSEIERLLHARFAAVKRDLADAKQGRFVNLAIFDHVFTGKPAKRPRATLAWKDWRGTPDIRFPAAERASLEPPSFAAPTSFSTPIPKPSILPPEPASLVPSTAVAPTQPAPAAAAAPAPAPATVVIPAGTAPASPEARISTLPTLPAVSSGPATPVASTEPSREVAASDAATAKSEPSIALAEPKKEPVVEVKIEPPAEVKIEPAPAQPAPAPVVPIPEEAAPARPTAAPVSAAPKTKPAAAPASAPAPAPAPAKREAYIPPVKTAAQAGKRMSGDELISELFEACGDLQFLRDSLEGADFVLSLALEKLPSEVGLVSLFDINRREFVVIRQAGGPRSIVLSRLPERAGLAQAAMRKKSALVVPDASKEPRALDDRFRTLGIVLHSLMVAPVEVSGRYLGLIELCNPVDGRAFTEGDGHALTYIGEQYAEFVAERGVILDPEQVIDRHQKR